MKLSSYIIYEKQYITLALYTLSCTALSLLKITISIFIGNKIKARIYAMVLPRFDEGVGGPKSSH
jgi:hypothetical protein